MNGVPNLAIGNPLKNIAVSILGVAQSMLWDAITAKPRWGIYVAGTSIPVVLTWLVDSKLTQIQKIRSLSALKALLNGQGTYSDIKIDSIISMDYTKSAQVSDYIIETGSFANFNKVIKPRTVSIRISKIGNEEERRALTDWLQAMQGSLRLWDVATPEDVFSNMSLIEYSIKRESTSGVTIIFADCVFQEIRQVDVQYANSKTNTVNAQKPEDQPASSTLKSYPVEKPTGFSGTFI